MQLPEVMLRARATSTVGAYSGALRKWIDWASKYSKVSIPADPFDLALYLVYLSKSSKSPAPITKAVAAISWAHKLAGADDISSSSIVSYTAEGIKRSLAKPVTKKDPISIDTLKHLVDKYIGVNGHNVSNLLNLRTVTMCLVSYAGFLRFNELSHIKLEHVIFHPAGMNILIPSSKTDVYRSGRSVIISSAHSPYCPVEMLKSYIALAGISDPNGYIFRNLTKVKMGYKIREVNQPLSYTRAREMILDALKPFVDDVSHFGVHSLRAGGATEAANAGVPDRLFKRHGRWKSESAKDGYVQDSNSNLLSVSKALGL